MPIEIDAVEGMRIAEYVSVRELQELVVSSCIAAILVIAAGIAAYKGWKMLREKCRGKHPASIAIGAFFTMVAIVVGGTKPTVSFPYTDIEKRYFIDAGSTVEADHIHLAFTAVGIPMSADFLGYYRSVDSTDDADWTQFLAGTVGAYITPCDIPFPNAKQYAYQFFSTYTAGPTVHTNGVLNVKWGLPSSESADGTLKAIPVQTEVRFDWRIIATPTSVHSNLVDGASDAALINLQEENDDE